MNQIALAFTNPIEIKNMDPEKHKIPDRNKRDIL